MADLGDAAKRERTAEVIRSFGEARLQVTGTSMMPSVWPGDVLSFFVKLKTNAVMIHATDADRIQALPPDSVQISIYSHRPEIHDAITQLPGSLKRSLAATRLLVERGVKVIFANVLMHGNFDDHSGVQALAAEVGAKFTIDPTITPMMDGDRSILNLNIERAQLQQVFQDPSLVGAAAEEFYALPTGPLAHGAAMEMLPCSAGHTCYVSPYGDVYPCVQFPLATGNVPTTSFIDVWTQSSQMNEVRSITMDDLPVCSTCSHGGTCSRCPGLAYLEGNVRGPSSQDCENSYARTDVITAGMLAHNHDRSAVELVQSRSGSNDRIRQTRCRQASRSLRSDPVASTPRFDGA